LKALHECLKKDDSTPRNALGYGKNAKNFYRTISSNPPRQIPYAWSQDDKLKIQYYILKLLLKSFLIHQRDFSPVQESFNTILGFATFQRFGYFLKAYIVKNSKYKARYF